MADHVDVVVRVGRTHTFIQFENEQYSAEHTLTPEHIRELEELARCNGTPIEYGRRLFEWVFQGEAYDGFRRASGIGGSPNRLVRLQLRLDSPELQALHWECLVDSNRPGVLLGRAPHTTVARLVPLPRLPEYELGRGAEPKVLVVVPNPPGQDPSLPRLNMGEKQQMRIGGVPPDEAGCELLDPPASLRAITNRLSEGFHVLHLVARSGIDSPSDAYLLLEQESKQEPHKAYIDNLVDLTSGAHSLRLLVLVTCFSRTSQTIEMYNLAQSLIRDGDLSAVILLREELQPREADTFVTAFYEQLKSGRSGLVDVAVNEARLRISQDSNGRWKWLSPILLLSGDNLLEEFLRRNLDRAVPVGTEANDEYRVITPFEERWNQINRRTMDLDRQRVLNRSRTRDHDLLLHRLFSRRKVG